MNLKGHDYFYVLSAKFLSVAVRLEHLLLQPQYLGHCSRRRTTLFPCQFKTLMVVWKSGAFLLYLIKDKSLVSVVDLKQSTK